MREDYPTLHRSETMYEALDQFGRTESDRLPVTGPNHTFLGNVSAPTFSSSSPENPKRSSPL